MPLASNPGPCMKSGKGPGNSWQVFLYVLSQHMITSSFARFARSATSPSYAYVTNPAPDSSLCRAAAPRLRTLQLLLPDCIDPLQTAVPRFHPLQLLPTDYVPSAVARHSRSLQLLFPDFNSSPIVFASAAAPRLLPLQLLLPDCICL